MSEHLEQWGRRDFPNREDDTGKMAEASQQVVLQSETGCSGSGRDSQLAIDRAYMGIDRDQTDDELPGNLGIGQTLN